MARLLVSLIAGGLFGAGLIISQMVNPARVLGFLDVAGTWDPTLAFVLDGRLILGAVLFGIGWGLVGFCPGPALAALGTGDNKALAFLAAMAAGMWLFGRIARR